MGLLMMLSPKLFAFDLGGPEAWVPFTLGAVTLVYSALTNYDFGVLRRMSFRTHLTLDALGGMLLAASPWLFAFAYYVWLPHMLIGLVAIAAVLSTRTTEMDHTSAPGTPAQS